jgi:hypothetical protein
MRQKSRAHWIYAGYFLLRKTVSRVSAKSRQRFCSGEQLGELCLQVNTGGSQVGKQGLEGFGCLCVGN